MKDLIGLPMYADAKVVAGGDGMAGSVYSVNIMDAPDIIHFLKPHELLLTTGYAIKDRPGALLTLVQSMAEVGCAGLAIKTRRFFDEVPADVLRCADALQFPVIELSLERSLGEIANLSLSHILEKRTDELHYAMSIHKQLTQMIMRGSTTEELLNALAERIEAPVLLADRHASLLARSAGCDAAWHARLLPQLSAAGEDGTEPRAVTLQEGGRVYTAELHPIVTFQPEGDLIAIVQSGHPQLNLIRHAVEQAAGVLGLELVKRQAVKERSRRYKNEFFCDFVDGRITSEQELAHRSKHYRLLHHSAYLCAFVRRDDEAAFRSTAHGALLAEGGRRISERDRLYQLLKEAATRLGLRFVLFPKDDGFCFLIGRMEEGANAQKEERTFLSMLEEIVGRLHEAHQIPISIGVGNPVPQLTDIPLSYREATEALASGCKAGKRRFVQPYRAKDLGSLLRMLPKEELREYYEETFRALLAVGGKEREDLMRTLYVYYDTHCQLAETAKRLFVHRNTVIYRLDKCERLTGRPLRDPAESLRFRTAFAAERLLEPDQLPRYVLYPPGATSSGT
ncbi:PucR family transcriptional regulator [Paenibacillus sp. IB182496]|uniref:PucR family transcriptional regulator n=1 Tax=Paenibacillus sabuli TaxID=2772509 RepID=A0A927GUC4_9BACL|nr:PucR family transcriptional regulator [Paenibacillus sabuli]MBD2848523.1 PucR family transcriptional regulator [Paenibacillus sabuli]